MCSLHTYRAFAKRWKFYDYIYFAFTPNRFCKCVTQRLVTFELLSYRRIIFRKVIHLIKSLKSDPPKCCTNHIRLRLRKNIPQRYCTADLVKIFQSKLRNLFTGKSKLLSFRKASYCRACLYCVDQFYNRHSFRSTFFSDLFYKKQLQQWNSY